MAEANLQKSGSLYLLGLKFSTDMKGIDYDKSVDRSAAKKGDSLSCVRQFY